MLSFKLLARVGLRAHLTDEETEAQPSLRSHSWCTDSHSCCTRLLLPSLSGSSRTRRRPWSRLCLPGHWQNHLLWVHSELLLLFFKLVLMDQESHTPILTPPHSPEAIDMGAGGGAGHAHAPVLADFSYVFMHTSMQPSQLKHVVGSHLRYTALSWRRRG